MSEKWAIQHFRELQLSFKDLEDVPEDAVALFSISSYAVSELNVIARMLLAVMHAPEKDTAISAAGFIQTSCALRYWTLKLFEFYECMRSIVEGKGEKHQSVICAVEAAVSNFKELKEDSSFSLARNVRHEAAGHYSFEAAKKNIRFVAPNAIASMYVHQQAGNSFFPFGEEVMFVGRMNRHGSSLKSDEERVQLVSALFAWDKRATKWVKECHMLFFRELIRPYLSGRIAKKRSYWVDPNKVGELKDFNVPLFASVQSEAAQ
ncbi:MULTISPECIES: hypothetical protein [unclassified Phaeobacter]|uniref:hypothetical protein n=1 Tax=unclassified Phaeobacter TaxID=2621772 RepID=UPI003A8637EA